MSSSVPIVRPASWSAVVLQAMVYGIAATLGYVLIGRDGIVTAIVVCLLYSLFSRYIILRDHRAGISLVKRQRFQEAITCFEACFSFLEKNPWIDRYRSVVLMSPAAMSYREMELANIAFCYSQIGDGENARRYYKTCLEQYPRNGLATAALRMMRSASNDAGKPEDDAQ